MPDTFRIRLNQAMKARKKARYETKSAIVPSPIQAATFELVPARASRGRALDKILSFVKAAAEDRRLCALSITDNAGGFPALSPNALGQEIKALGIDPIIHFSCKDKNRNEIESQLFELDRNGLTNLLVMTGDYPGRGYMGKAKPVFDLDSVHVLEVISRMNKGVALDSRDLARNKLPMPLDLFPGCVVSPFKVLEAELVPQYLKLRKKINSGAKFVISQLGYDVRKYHELRLFMDINDLDIPLIGTVFIPTLKLARMLHNGLIPGCTFPKRLLETFEREATDREHELRFRLDLGARLVAVLKGLGYEGVHLSGPSLDYEHIAWILKKADEIADNFLNMVRDLLFPEDWRFFYFKEDPMTGLNTPELTATSKTPLSPANGLEFALGRVVHALAFEPGRFLYGPIKNLAEKIRGTAMERPFAGFEYFMKKIIYDCRKCGDCALGETAFLCPQSQCAKFLLNGPCGGSRNGWCEVWPGQRRCLYVRAFERLSHVGRVNDLGGPPVPPRDWNLYLTSSWINFYLGLDHSSKSRSDSDSR